jgi:hypothetical protein
VQSPNIRSSVAQFREGAFGRVAMQFRISRAIGG